MRKLATLLIYFGFVTLFFFTWLFITKTTKLNFGGQIDPDVWAQYGSLIGGFTGAIFSLAGVLLLIATLEKQEQHFDKQQFEARYFELLRIHRDNSAQIRMPSREGRRVFVTLLRELNDSLLIVTAQSEGLPPGLKLSETDALNIAYKCFFYGAIGETSGKMITRVLAKHGDWGPRIIKAFKESQPSFNRKYNYSVFEGHQSRLSHYYRHLYQTVKFVNNQEMLDYKAKYGYVKLLRAQLSTHEQALLFYNSISDLGGPWEFEAGLVPNQKLITKYNLIKNIPEGFTGEVHVDTYFPDVQFESHSKSASRVALESQYK